MTEKSSDPKESIEQLKQAYQDFARPVGRSMTGFGCSMALVVIAAIVVGASVSWLLGIIGGIAVIALLIFISNRVEAPHKKRAKERVSQLEEQYGLSHQESFDVLFSTRTEAATGDKNEWKTFVTEVWGQAALTPTQKPEGTPESAAGPGSSNCPRCKSDSIDRKSEFKSSKKGHVAGQLLFGIVGNIVAGAAFGRTVENCECKSCGYKWVNEKGSAPAPGAPPALETPSLPPATCVSCGTPLLGEGPYCVRCMRR